MLKLLCDCSVYDKPAPPTRGQRAEVTLSGCSESQCSEVKTHLQLLSSKSPRELAAEHLQCSFKSCEDRAAALEEQQQQAQRDRQQQAAEAKENRAMNVPCSVLAGGGKANERGLMSYLQGDCRCSKGQALFPIACQHYGADLEGFTGAGSDRRFNKAPIVDLRTKADYSMLPPAILKETDEFGHPRNFQICHCEDDEGTFDQKWIQNNIAYRRFLEGNPTLHEWNSGRTSFKGNLEDAKSRDGCDTAYFKETAIWACIFQKRRYDAYMPKTISLSTGKFKGLRIELFMHHFAGSPKLQVKIVDEDCAEWSVYDEERPTSKALALTLGSSQEVDRSKNTQKYMARADVYTDAQKPYAAEVQLKFPVRKWDRDKMKYSDPDYVHAHISIDVSTAQKRSSATFKYHRGEDKAVVKYQDP